MTDPALTSPAAARRNQLRLAIRWAGYAGLDVVDSLRGRRSPLIPPHRINPMGSANFREIGDEFLGYLEDLAGLTPTSDVLDIGCGAGRMAVSLANHLTTEGTYHGFDVHSPSIRWCRKALGATHDHFFFTEVDVANVEYHPDGHTDPRRFRFPAEADSVDVSLAASVYTHMVPADVAHYIEETARVLRPGGRSLATFFLLRDETRTKSPPRNPLIVDHGDFRTTDRRRPGRAVAIEETAVRAMYGAAGLEICEPIRYGDWAGTEGLSLQDIVVARRPR